MTTPLRVAYLVSQYPAISHSFIEREVHGLRDRGVEVHTFSIRACPESELRSEQMRADAAATTLVKDAPKLAIADAHRRLLAREPRAYSKLFARAARTGELTARARLWQAFYFAEAVMLHDDMERRGLHHVHVHFPNVAADVARLTVELGRMLDGEDSPWRWSMSIHGPTEFENVVRADLAAKVEHADGVAAITDFARSQLMRLTDPEHWSKIAKVRMSVDPSRYLPPADGRRDHGGPLRLLSVGRLVPEKGSPVLVDAVRRLREQGIDTEVRLVGAGPLEPLLRREIAAAGLEDRIRLLGLVGQDDLPEQYHWADVFVLPSFQEGLPVVLMEALATELPVVTTRIAGIAELVQDGTMGAVVSPGRSDLIADAVAQLASVGPEGRRERGRAGRQAVLDDYTTASTAAAMEDFLRTVVG